MLGTFRLFRSTRLLVLLVGSIVFFLVKGVSGLIGVARLRAPVEMSCAEYAAEKPSAPWVSLSDCRIDVRVGMLAQHSGSTGCAVLLTSDEEDGKPAAILLSDDEELVAAVGRYARGPYQDPTPIEELPFRESRSIGAMLVPEFELRDEQHAAYNALIYGRGDLPILALGEQPSVSRSLLYLLASAGLLALAAGIVWLKVRDTAGEGLPPAGFPTIPRPP